MLLVDAANVIGSRPTGWWKDRAGAAARFVGQLRAAVASGRITGPVVVVLEGKARAGVAQGEGDGQGEGDSEGVTVLHADGSGDDALVDAVAAASGQSVPLVTADRALRHRAEALGADVVGPGWLLERLEAGEPGSGRSAGP